MIFLPPLSETDGDPNIELTGSSKALVPNYTADNRQINIHRRKPRLSDTEWTGSDSRRSRWEKIILKTTYHRNMCTRFFTCSPTWITAWRQNSDFKNYIGKITIKDASSAKNDRLLAGFVNQAIKKNSLQRSTWDRIPSISPANETSHLKARIYGLFLAPVPLLTYSLHGAESFLRR